MALEAGLLTLGSSYWPTPSQRLPRQWSIPLAFVPDHSGASVRELHPLPSSSTSRAATAIVTLLVSPRVTYVKPILGCPGMVRDTVRSPGPPHDWPPVLEHGTRHVAAAERFTRTKQGYRRFRCRPCQRGLNGQIRTPSQRRHRSTDVISLGVLWCFQYHLILRDWADMLRRREITYRHDAALDWAIKLAPRLADTFKKRLGAAASIGSVDETAITIQGRWSGLYQRMDRAKSLIEAQLRHTRDFTAAETFLHSTWRETGVVPARLSIDRYDAYPGAIRTVGPSHH
jgi:transposase-like protein